FPSERPGSDAPPAGEHVDRAVLTHAGIDVGQPAGASLTILDLVAVARAEQRAHDGLSARLRHHRHGRALEERRPVPERRPLEFDERPRARPAVVYSVAGSVTAGWIRVAPPAM